MELLQPPWHHVASLRLKMGIRGKGACVFGVDAMEMFNRPVLVSAVSLDFSLREVIYLLIYFF